VRAVVDGTMNFEYDSQEWKEISQTAVDFVRKLLEPDSQKRTKAVTALNDKWLLSITKARKQNHKSLSQHVCNTYKTFLSELRFYQSLSDLILIVTISQEEGKLLTYLFRQRDQTGEGFLKMDDIREVYTAYCGGLIEPNVIDTNLSKCTISISKRGQIRYREFIEII
jgi:serine/threonine protein kinase